MPDRQAEMRLMLRALRLPAIAAVYEDLALKPAKANLTHEEFLYELLRAECLQREEHRVARLLRLSGLPPDKTFRTPEELRAQFKASLGSVPTDHVICYCGSGVTACHNLLALEHAGLQGAKLYAGSWSEWSSDPARPVERG